jgi:hypothetical protein
MKMIALGLPRAYKKNANKFDCPPLAMNPACFSQVMAESSPETMFIIQLKKSLCQYSQL